MREICPYDWRSGEWKVKKARKYAIPPIQRTALKPMTMASMMVSIGARTEKQPLTAHAHGMREGFPAPSDLIPSGNGIPMRKPSGMSTINDMAILIGNAWREIASDIAGITRLYAIMRNEIIKSTDRFLIKEN